jgi:hypothetical protein
MRVTLTRDFYVPKNAVPVDCAGTDAAVFVYEAAGKPYSIAFHGKAQKPDFHYCHRSDEQRQKTISEYLEGRKATAQFKAVRMAERKAPHGMKLGDILYSSWGYDQTNIDFYEVTTVISDRAIEIRKIGKTVAESGQYADKVMPVPGHYLSEPMLKRPNQYGCKITDYAHASKWDGKPKSETAFGYGH